MSTYTDAVKAIKVISNSKQDQLDLKAGDARATNLEAQRAAILAWVPTTSPWHPVVKLLADTLEIGDEEDYPRLHFPDSTRDVLRAAIVAGFDNFSLLPDCTGFETSPDPDAHRDDYAAWSEASQYRARQCHAAL